MTRACDTDLPPRSTRRDGSFYVVLLWRKKGRKVYLKRRNRWTLHFGRLSGRWSYGFDRLHDFDDPVGELEGRW